MTVVTTALDVMEDLVGDEASIDDGDGVIGESGPDPFRELDLGVGRGPKLGGRHQVRAEHHEGDDTDLGVSGSAPTAARPAERRLVLFGIGNAKGRSIDTVDRQSAPAMLTQVGCVPARSRRRSRDRVLWVCPYRAGRD